MKKITFADWFFLVVLAIITILYFNIIQPFFLDLVVTSLFVSLFWGLYSWLQKTRYVNNRIASLLTILVIILVFIVPFLIIGSLSLDQALEGVSTLQRNWPELQQDLASGALQERLMNLPFMDELLELADEFDIRGAVPEVAQFLANVLRSLLVRTTSFFFHLFIVIILMYFLFIGGDDFINKIKEISPLKEASEESLLRGMRRAVNAVIIGSFVSGLIDGVILAFLLVIFDIPSAILWGFTAFIFAFIPALGAPVIYLGAALYELAVSGPLPGLILFALGLAIPNIVEQLVRPKIVGEAGKMNPGIIIISTFGGLVLFGFIGIIIGPVAAALFLTIWGLFRERFKNKGYE